MLASDDDLHLVRMLALAGSQLPRLTHNTGCRLLGKFAEVANSRFMERMLLWVTRDLADSKALGFVEGGVRDAIRAELIHLESINSALSPHAQAVREYL